MLKAHSAGIGDLLRSSAAWRALKDRFPQTRLHLWFLTKDPGAAAESLIARHHLLTSFHVTDKRTKSRDGSKQLLVDGRKIVEETLPELIIDFEPYGFRTSLLAWRLGRWARAATVGIAEVPLRRVFYRRSAPSRRAYAARHEMRLPLEYTERDFVALAALGIERRGTAIELRETNEGRNFRERLLSQSCNTAGPLLGVNIGCGTPGAAERRPNLDLLAALAGELQRRHRFTLLLTGAPEENDINRQFLERLEASGPVVDLAGRTRLLELPGAIGACRLFISSDSGPYHIAVALRVPTLAVLNFDFPEACHRHTWVECLVAPNADSLSRALEAAERLLKVSPPPVPS